MSKYSLYALDLSRARISGIDVVVDGQMAYVDHGVVKYYVVRGERTFLIPGTPTVVIGMAEGGRIRLLGFWTGADVPSGVDLKRVFVEFLSSKGVQGDGDAFPYAALLSAFVLGVASAFSPCVLPVLGVAAVTHLARRSLPKVLLGMVLSYAAVGVAVAAVGGAVVYARHVFLAVGGAALLLLGAVLLVERLSVKYASAVSRLQTLAFKRLGSAGDFLFGFSLGSVWTPCILPYAGFATVVALASLAGNYLALFAALLLYGLGLAAAVYAVVRGVAKYLKGGRWVEVAVGVLSVAAGIYFLGLCL